MSDETTDGGDLGGGFLADSAPDPSFYLDPVVPDAGSPALTSAPDAVEPGSVTPFEAESGVVEPASPISPSSPSNLEPVTGPLVSSDAGPELVPSPVSPSSPYAVAEPASPPAPATPATPQQPQDAEPTAASDPGSPAPSPQELTAQEQTLAAEDPQLASVVQSEETQAEQASIADPQQAAAIYDELQRTEIGEVYHIDPALAQEIQAAANQGLVTFNDEGEPTAGTAPTEHVIGDPNVDASQWSFQGANGYCGPNSISMLIEAATGQHVAEQTVANYAIAHGEMAHLPAGDDPSNVPSIHYGMLPQQAADALNALGEQYGIHAELMTGSLSDLEGYLAQGREVMIELDDQRIWHQPGTPDSGAANHYVVVTGVDPSTNTVFINDPGTPDGREESIPLSDFESAWSTSNDVMIVTTTTSTDASDAASGGGLKQASPGPVLLPILLDRGLVHGG